ncbi:hypothetical protein MAR_035141 [Mya arenaria]|uniref:Uncharacterized protein n=1 Tax=Mya arenaria TaxID=6604 RepID=A0ABY7EJM3_MYAAR|nr:hypothetical protein MAR_035141 [Mya arenaria]
MNSALKMELRHVLLCAGHAEKIFRKGNHLSFSSPKLEILCEYIDDQWMSNSCWTVREWSCYRQSVRTNNDCEGWHRRINSKARRSNLQFYVLVPLLQREAANYSLCSSTSCPAITGQCTGN